MDVVFYDKLGKAIAYTEDGETIYNYGGRPMAYIVSDAIYAFAGKQLGWYEDGWIRDQGGNCVYFTDYAVGGPIKPIKQIKPIKNMKQMKPMKQLKEIKHLKPLKTFAWSEFMGVNFFDM